MAHFYGHLQGSRGETTRCGTKQSGMCAKLKSWKSSVDVELKNDEVGCDVYEIGISPIYGTGQGVIRIIINGEEFIYFKGKVYKGEHEVLGEKL